MSFVNWSLLFSHSFSRSLVEALLQKASVLTCVALSTVLLLINARAAIDAAAALQLRHRHGCGELAECSNSTLQLFPNLSHSSLTKGLPCSHPVSEIPCSGNRRCKCWFYIHSVPPVASQELFSPRSLPHPWLVSHCHLHLPVAELLLPSGEFQETCSRSNCIQPSTKSKDNFQRPTQFKITHNSVTRMLITYLSLQNKVCCTQMCTP